MGWSRGRLPFRSRCWCWVNSYWRFGWLRRPSGYWCWSHTKRMAVYITIIINSAFISGTKLAIRLIGMAVTAITGRHASAHCANTAIVIQTLFARRNRCPGKSRIGPPGKGEKNAADESAMEKLTKIHIALILFGASNFEFRISRVLTRDGS